MAENKKYRLWVEVRISDEHFQTGTLTVRDEVTIEPVTFGQMAEILQAFHVLCEKYRVK